MKNKEYEGFSKQDLRERLGAIDIEFMELKEREDELEEEALQIYKLLAEKEKK